MKSYHFQSVSLTSATVYLKGPKLEIFGSRVFPHIGTVCVGDLGTRRKNSKFLWFMLENRRFVLFSAVADIAKHF